MIHSPTKDFDRAEKYLRLRDQYQGPSEGQLRDMDQELSEAYRDRQSRQIDVPDQPKILLQIV